MKRLEIIQQRVEHEKLLDSIDIREVAKEAKLGWVKTLLLLAVWPLIKPILAKKLDPKVIKIIEDLLNTL